MIPVDLVLGRLEGVKERGEGYQALCPAHEDREPSLSVSQGEDGRALITCFAGCETEEIVTALGLEMKDLFERRNEHKKVLRPIPAKTTATLHPGELRRSQGPTHRVPAEARASGPELPQEALSGAYPVPGCRGPGECGSLQDRP